MWQVQRQEKDLFFPYEIYNLIEKKFYLPLVNFETSFKILSLSKNKGLNYSMTSDEWVWTHQALI